jgi:hypothetical protein
MMPFNIESHLIVLLNYLLSHERSHFFETFDVQSEQGLQDLVNDPSIQHIWKSARIVCHAFESNLIIIKGCEL